MLRFRADVVERIRTYFRMEGFLEVETPVLSQEIVVDAWLEPYLLEGKRDSPRYLQTSPEAHMKRLLAAGAGPIFQLSRVMRTGESGRLHNPEYTMLEWYKPGDTHLDQIAFVEQLLRQITTMGDRRLKSGASFDRLRYDEAFEQFAGTKVLHLCAAGLKDLANARKVPIPESMRKIQNSPGEKDRWLNLLLAELVEPEMAKQGVLFLYDYPASQAALAKICKGKNREPDVAERFELYVDGVEICNGYNELTDTVELERRFAEQNAIRSFEGLPELPLPKRLLTAMRHGLPECAGVALGVDRLIMLLAGAESIDEVIPFPWNRA